MHNSKVSYKNLAKHWIDAIVNPDLVDIEPDLIGRIKGTGEDMASVRSGTTLLASASVPFDGAAIGVATVNVFESTNCDGNGGGDDGGFVFRCTIRNDASSFQPHAVLIANGVDLHIAGDAEADAMLSALHQATKQALRIRCAPCNTYHVGEVNDKILPAARPRPGKH
jgi:hypothetical protein